MAETAFFSEVVKQVGIPALIFIIWVLYHRATMKIFEKIVDTQYNTLKDLIETNHCTIATLARIEQKIDNNIFCPLVKERTKELKKGDSQ